MKLNINEWKRKVDERKITIGIIGGGYVGVNVAAVFSKNRFKVTIYDIDKKKVEKINKGENYILDEEHLSYIIKDSVKKGYLKAFSNIKDAVKNDVILIDVPTTKGEDHEPTLDFIVDVCKTIGNKLRKNTLIIVESTVNIGATENIVRDILERESNLIAGKDFWLVFSPERIDPGNKIHTLENIPKIVGGIDSVSCELACYLYKKVIKKVVPVSNCRTAEFIKLVELTQRATLIAHIFEMAKIAEKYKINIEEVLDAAKTKWNFLYVRPSCGVGGYCVFPGVKRLLNADSRLLLSVKSVIEEMPIHIVKKVLEKIKKKSPRIGILGITYKANITDSRASPVKIIVKNLKKAGVSEIIGYDPKCIDNVEWIKLTDDIKDIFKCDCIIIGTDHDEFKDEEFKRNLIKNIESRNILVIDSRNLFAEVDHPLIIGVGK